jgi:hypothetical protein
LAKPFRALQNAQEAAAQHVRYQRQQAEADLAQRHFGGLWPYPHSR